MASVRTLTLTITSGDKLPSDTEIVCLLSHVLEGYLPKRAKFSIETDGEIVERQSMDTQQGGCPACGCGEGELHRLDCPRRAELKAEAAKQGCTCALPGLCAVHEVTEPIDVSKNPPRGARIEHRPHAGPLSALSADAHAALPPLTPWQQCLRDFREAGVSAEDFFDIVNRDQRLVTDAEYRAQWLRDSREPDEPKREPRVTKITRTWKAEDGSLMGQCVMSDGQEVKACLHRAPVGDVALRYVPVECGAKEDAAEPKRGMVCQLPPDFLTRDYTPEALENAAEAGRLDAERREKAQMEAFASITSDTLLSAIQESYKWNALTEPPGCAVRNG